MNSVLQILQHYSCYKVWLHSYSDGNSVGAQLVVACPTPVRAAEDWLEPRDREGGNKENQTWIIALKRARANSTSARVFIWRIRVQRAEEQCLCVIWKCSICQCYVCLKLICTLNSRGGGIPLPSRVQIVSKKRHIIITIRGYMTCQHTAI